MSQSSQPVDLDRYSQFVTQNTSQCSADLEAFIARIRELHTQGVNVPGLITGMVGLSGEVGEFVDLHKKILFQGKPLSSDAKEAAKKELGDIFWYWIKACQSLGLDPNNVIQANVKKLQARYPDGEFNVLMSESLVRRSLQDALSGTDPDSDPA